MRWVEGTDLRSVIAARGNARPRPASCAIVEQVAAALDAAHAGGLVHRDVKPANVMLTTTHGREHVYLIDFGLTKRTASATALTRTGAFVGTPTTCRPSRSRASRPTRARTSTRSGACSSTRSPAGRRTTGTPRWRRCTRSCTTRRPARAGSFPAPRPGLDAVITRALAKDAGGRYPSAGDLGRAARAALTGADPSQPERSLATGPAAPHRCAGRVRRTRPRRPPAPPPTRSPRRPPARWPPPERSAGAVRCRSALARAGGLAAPWRGILAAAGVFSGDDGGRHDGCRLRQTGEARWRTTSRRAGARTGIDRERQHGLGRQFRGRRAHADRRQDQQGRRGAVPVGRNPDVVVADGSVWVTNTDDGTVTRLCRGRARASTTIPVGAGPGGHLSRIAAPLGGQRRRRQRQPDRPGVGGAGTASPIAVRTSRSGYSRAPASSGSPTASAAPSAASTPRRARSSARPTGWGGTSAA